MILEDIVIRLIITSSLYGSRTGVLFAATCVVVLPAYVLFMILSWNESLSKTKLADNTEDRLWWYLSGFP